MSYESVHGRFAFDQMDAEYSAKLDYQAALRRRHAFAKFHKTVSVKSLYPQTQGKDADVTVMGDADAERITVAIYTGCSNTHLRMTKQEAEQLAAVLAECAELAPNETNDK